MTGKVAESDPKGLLILILPLAVAMVFIYKTWRWILLGLTLAIAWVAWDTYQWQQKCVAIDPLFNQLVQKNQGIITKADLIEAGIARGRAAERYLDDKIKEYGPYEKKVGEAKVYYFISSSTLGNIFDDSEPQTEEPAIVSPQLTAATAPVVDHPLVPPQEELMATPVGQSPFSQLAEIKEARRQEEEERTTLGEVRAESTAETMEESPTITSPALSLIQSELAKRLDTTSSTLARRKNEDNFADWSQTRDPDGLAWSYDPESKLFITI
ncbi:MULTISPECIES: hypothetical protein [unclassified Synechocystis]|uniref:hypothetical protein n=1 Tax=unclassified Synechocystis TaxID=2640012 RepID=UPI0004224015|nr:MULTISPECIES: hypothetical protein [unclassified Synechocystis]AIE74443.1 hypothetical protein D082_19150 [Synechocystis sp. PCC 6714]MCT0254790.1 hypothetical protein [Synechocystis sp. CS-94]